MNDRLVPPEFQIRETQVMEFSEPNPDVFYPNNQGSQGWSHLPPKLDRQVGMDPAMRYGQDSANAASQSGSEAVAELMRQTGINQINTTRVTEHEGGSTVTYHEPTRDQQVSSVAGRAVTGDPQNVQQALLVGDRPTEREPTVEAYQAREAMNRQTQGMNEGTRMAFLEKIRHQGTEAVESVSSGIHEAIGTRIVKATDSGVPYYDQLHGNNPALIELKELMRYHGERQRKGAAKPVAKYHPSQSNYRSRHGAFAGLTLPADMQSRLPSLKPISSVLAEGPGDTKSLLQTAQPQVLSVKATTYQPTMLSRLMQQQGTAPATGTESFASQLDYESKSLMKTIPGTAAPAEPLPGDMAPGPVPGPTPGNGDEDSRTYVGEDGIAYYEEPTPTFDPLAGGLSRNAKIGIAVAAGVGLLLLLRG